MSGRETALKRARMMREVMLDYGVPEVGVGGLLPGRPVPAGRDPWNSLDPVSVFSHHIVSRPTLSNPTPGLYLVRHGHSSLSGPLCNGTAGVDLVYRFVTLGWANHPGFGGPLTVRGPLGNFTIPENNARPYAWGTEYEGGYSEEVWDREYTNRRTGKKMTFREFMGRCNAALAEAIWLPGISSRDRYGRIDEGVDLSGYHAEHKTWAPTRKIDRLGYTTESGRAEIRNAIRLTKQEEDEMHYNQWPKRAKRALARDVADEVVKKLQNETVSIRSRDGGKGKVTYHQALGRAANAPQVIRNQVEGLSKDIDAALAQIDADNSTAGETGEA